MSDNPSPETAGVEVKPDDHYAARKAKPQSAPVMESPKPEAVEPPKVEEKPAETASAETVEQKTEETAAPEAGETETTSEQEQAQAKKRQRRTLEEENYRLRQKNRELREAMESRGENGASRSAETQTPPQPAKRPRQEDFQDYDAYIEAVADWKADQKLQDFAARQMRQQSEAQIQNDQRSKAQRFSESASKARDKYDDFDELVTDPDLTITPAMAAIVSEADDPGELAYHLARNPQEARRIANLSPAKAAMELGRIEDKMKAQAPKPVAAIPPKRETQAPPPPKVVSGGNAKPQQRLEERAPDDYYAQRKANLKAGVR